MSVIDALNLAQREIILAGSNRPFNLDKEMEDVDTITRLTILKIKERVNKNKFGKE